MLMQPLPYYAMPALLVKPCSVLCASSTVLCTYACAVCASDNDGVTVEPTQLTELRCDHPQCFILELEVFSEDIPHAVLCTV